MSGRDVRTAKDRFRSPPEPGLARREAPRTVKCRAQKKGAHGGNMVSPMQG